jgi:hypothetical protein
VYRHPVELLAEVERSMESIPLAEFFGSSAYKVIREEWCAAMFGVGLQKVDVDCQVAINDVEATPCDFYVRIGPEELGFQNVEAMRKGRRRGDEYKSEEPRPYRPQEGRKNGPGWVRAAIEHKIRKRYARAEDLHLLVYANLDAPGLEYDAMLEETADLLEAFASTWVITSTHICSLKSSPLLPSMKGWSEVRQRNDYGV